MIHLVGLEVLGQLRDAGCQHGYLHVGRAGVAAGEGVLLDDLLLGVLGQRHGRRPRLPAGTSSEPGESAAYHDGVRRSDRLRTTCGILGPAAFTAAWLLAQRRQDEYQVRHEHISGLAARDATEPQLMTAGFFALGTCTVAFASALERRLGPRPGLGPALIGVAGLATIAAGVFRRDRRSNFPPPGEPAGQSWVNDVHDAAAAVGGAAGTLGLVALAPALAREPALRDLARPALGAASRAQGSPPGSSGTWSDPATDCSSGERHDPARLHGPTSPADAVEPARPARSLSRETERSFASGRRRRRSRR